jgi:hypothetical protein
MVEDTNSAALDDAVTWPHINLKDLVKPGSLPVFIRSCGHHSSGDFSASELEKWSYMQNAAVFAQ